MSLISPFLDTTPRQWTPEQFSQMADKLNSMIVSGHPDAVAHAVQQLITEEFGIVGSFDKTARDMFLAKQGQSAAQLLDGLQHTGKIEPQVMSLMAKRLGISYEVPKTPSKIEIGLG